MRIRLEKLSWWMGGQPPPFNFCVVRGNQNEPLISNITLTLRQPFVIDRDLDFRDVPDFVLVSTGNAFTGSALSPMVGRRELHLTLGSSYITLYYRAEQSERVESSVSVSPQVQLSGQPQLERKSSLGNSSSSSQRQRNLLVENKDDLPTIRSRSPSPTQSVSLSSSSAPIASSSSQNVSGVVGSYFEFAKNNDSKSGTAYELRRMDFCTGALAQTTSSSSGLVRIFCAWERSSVLVGQGQNQDAPNQDRAALIIDVDGVPDDTAARIDIHHCPVLADSPGYLNPVKPDEPVADPDGLLQSLYVANGRVVRQGSGQRPYFVFGPKSEPWQSGKYPYFFFRVHLRIDSHVLTARTSFRHFVKQYEPACLRIMPRMVFVEDKTVTGGNGPGAALVDRRGVSGNQVIQVAADQQPNHAQWSAPFENCFAACQSGHGRIFRTNPRDMIRPPRIDAKTFVTNTQLQGRISGTRSRSKELQALDAALQAYSDRLSSGSTYQALRNELDKIKKVFAAYVGGKKIDVKDQQLMQLARLTRDHKQAFTELWKLVIEGAPLSSYEKYCLRLPLEIDLSISLVLSGPLRDLRITALRNSGIKSFLERRSDNQLSQYWVPKSTKDLQSVILMGHQPSNHLPNAAPLVIDSNDIKSTVKIPHLPKYLFFLSTCRSGAVTDLRNELHERGTRFVISFQTAIDQKPINDFVADFFKSWLKEKCDPEQVQSIYSGLLKTDKHAALDQYGIRLTEADIKSGIQAKPYTLDNLEQNPQQQVVRASSASSTTLIRTDSKTTTNTTTTNTTTNTTTSTLSSTTTSTTTSTTVNLISGPPLRQPSTIVTASKL